MRIALSVFITTTLITGLTFSAQAQTQRGAGNDLRSRDDNSRASRPISKEVRDHARRLQRAGVRYGRAKLFRQAAASFQQAIQLDPNYAEAYFGLGQAYLDLGRWREAIDALEHVIKLDPDEQTYRKLGEAQAMWRAELKKLPAEERKTAINSALKDSQAPADKSPPTSSQPRNDIVASHSRSELAVPKENSRPFGRSAGPGALSAKPPPVSDRVSSPVTRERQPNVANRTLNASLASQPPASRSVGIETRRQPSETNRPNSKSSQPSPSPRKIMEKVPATKSAPKLEWAAKALARPAASYATGVRVALDQAPPVFVSRPTGNGLFGVSAQPVGQSKANSDKAAPEASLPVLPLSLPEFKAKGDRVQLNLAASPAVNSVAKVIKDNSSAVKAETEATGTPNLSELQAMASPPALPINSPAPFEAKPVDLTRLYRVGIGDVLDIRLRDAPSQGSTLFSVSASGLLEHPMLSHPLRVVGLTPDEISVRVATDLKNRAVSDNPEVLVGVREYVSHSIIVSGLVSEPGTKILRREAIPLYVVLADAQPLPDSGRAIIVSNETRETRVVDLMNPQDMNHLIRPGDVITVQPSPKQFFYIGGEVKMPGEKSYRPGLTLTQAILAAGGLSGKGREVQLAREAQNGLLTVTRYKLKDINAGKKVDPVIHAGDRITVTN